jgi:hypothetical protein
LNSSEREPQVSVIIVNHNGISDLEGCLRSLTENCISCEIIVVDNNSTDGSREMISGQFPQVLLISNPVNRGFPAANNQGIRASKGNYLLFLNPDTKVYPQALEILLTGMQERQECGGMGPALLTGENEYQVSFGSRVGFFPQMVQKCCLNPYYRRNLKKSVKIRDVGWLSGACLLVRREVIEEIGLFDESFFLYFEDIDLCYRIREKGWKLCFFPESKIFHRGGTSTEKQKLASRFYYRKSQLYFYAKHNSRLALMLLRYYLRMNFIGLAFFGVMSKEKGFPTRHNFFALLKK